MKVYKKLLAVLLACVLSLSLLTACGGGGGGSGSGAINTPTTNQGIVRAMGCSDDIKENEEIMDFCATDILNIVKLASGQITQAQYNNTILPLASKLEASLAEQGITKSHIVSVVGGGSDLNAAIERCKEGAKNAGYSLADMKQYGLARFFYTDPETGDSVCLLRAIFTF